MAAQLQQEPSGSTKEVSKEVMKEAAKEVPKKATGSGLLAPSLNPVETITAQVDKLQKTGVLPTSEQVSELTQSIISKSDDLVKSVAKRTGIRIAPVNIPLARRRQTLAVMVQSSLFWTCLILNVWAVRCWQGIPFYLYVLYLAWKLLFQTYHSDGGRPLSFVRNAALWEWFANYFPLTLHKSANLDPNQVYIFGYHPHGIIGLGAWSTFAAQRSGFPTLFPNIDVRLLTLRGNFYIPFWDLILTSMGICDASRESCDTLLSNGTSLTLVLGGAKESLDAHSTTNRLYLKNRKGFVKVAISHGASLVPTFGFGENALYLQVANPRGSLIRNIQDKLQRHMGFALPLFRGRGVFLYDFGMLPLRNPLDVVFGAPIKCPQVERSAITQEMIDEYHGKYMTGLREVYDAYKDQFYSENAPELVFV